MNDTVCRVLFEANITYQWLLRMGATFRSNVRRDNKSQTGRRLNASWTISSPNQQISHLIVPVISAMLPARETDGRLYLLSRRQGSGNCAEPYHVPAMNPMAGLNATGEKSGLLETREGGGIVGEDLVSVLLSDHIPGIKSGYVIHRRAPRAPITRFTSLHG